LKEWNSKITGEGRTGEGNILVSDFVSLFLRVKSKKKKKRESKTTRQWGRLRESGGKDKKKKGARNGRWQGREGGQKKGLKKRK